MALKIKSCSSTLWVKGGVFNAIVNAAFLFLSTKRSDCMIVTFSYLKWSKLLLFFIEHPADTSLPNFFVKTLCIDWIISICGILVNQYLHQVLGQLFQKTNILRESSIASSLNCDWCVFKSQKFLRFLCFQKKSASFWKNMECSHIANSAFSIFY